MPASKKHLILFSIFIVSNYFFANNQTQQLGDNFCDLVKSNTPALTSFIEFTEDYKKIYTKHINKDRKRGGREKLSKSGIQNIRCFIFQDILRNRYILNWKKDTEKIINSQSNLSKRKKARLKELIPLAIKEIQELAINCSIDKKYESKLSLVLNASNENGLYADCSEDIEPLIADFDKSSIKLLNRYADFERVEKILYEASCLGDKEAEDDLNKLRSFSQNEMICFSLHVWKRINSSKYSSRTSDGYKKLQQRIKKFNPVGNDISSILIQYNANVVNQSSSDGLTVSQRRTSKILEIGLGPFKENLDKLIGLPGKEFQKDSFLVAEYPNQYFYAKNKEPKNNMYKPRTLVLYFNTNKRLTGFDIKQ